MRQRIWLFGLLALLAIVGWAPAAHADEAPITGTVKGVDAAASIITVQSFVKGRAREVAIHVRPDTKFVRFARAAEGKGGFTEQAATLADIKPGWTVSVTTHHEGDKEVAHLVRVVHER
jgi:hypothetical protein